MPRPFEVDLDYLQDHLDEMVTAIFQDLQSQFLVLPKGNGFVEYSDFQDAYETLKRASSGFRSFESESIWNALEADSLALLVLRTILGMTPPEWADLSQSETGVEIPQGFARTLDANCRTDRGYISRSASRGGGKTKERIEALVATASQQISSGAPAGAADTVHRLAKVDTTEGMAFVRHAASHDVPYAVLLYERYLGRPFASHRDSISELIGDVMESAIEDRLHRSSVSYRKTKRAERVPGFDQAPDFFGPDELNPAALIEAKITGDDGTARDKATRIVHLAEMRDARVREGLEPFEVIACIDGRGFGVRREDMRRILHNTRGKVFTLATLDQLIEHTTLRQFKST